MFQFERRIPVWLVMLMCTSGEEQSPACLPATVVVLPALTTRGWAKPRQNWIQNVDTNSQEKMQPEQQKTCCDPTHYAVRGLCIVSIHFINKSVQMQWPELELMSTMLTTT